MLSLNITNVAAFQGRVPMIPALQWERSLLGKSPGKSWTHEMVWFGRDFKVPLVPPPGWAGTASSRSGCSELQAGKE